jgi:hypothetical protein
LAGICKPKSNPRARAFFLSEEENKIFKYLKIKEMK